MPDIDVTATLAAIRERAKAAADFPLTEFAKLTGPDTKTVGGLISASALDVPPLLAAIEAVLKQADHWDREAARLNGVAARSGTKNSTPGTRRRAWALQGCADALREAVRTALGGKDSSDGN